MRNEANFLLRWAVVRMRPANDEVVAGLRQKVLPDGERGAPQAHARRAHFILINIWSFPKPFRFVLTAIWLMPRVFIVRPGREQSSRIRKAKLALFLLLSGRAFNHF